MYVSAILRCVVIPLRDALRDATMPCPEIFRCREHTPRASADFYMVVLALCWLSSHQDYLRLSPML